MGVKKLLDLNNALISRQDENKAKQKVCTFWLQGTCKKGDDCGFLHVYDKDKLPPCRFFQENGHCHKGDECLFKHERPAQDPNF